MPYVFSLEFDRRFFYKLPERIKKSYPISWISGASRILCFGQDKQPEAMLECK